MTDDKLLALIRARLMFPLDLRRFAGRFGTVYCYAPPAGGSPSKDFLDSLSEEAQASYGVLFERYCTEGKVRGDKFHNWDNPGFDGISEFKDIQSQSRIICIKDDGQTVILLFGFGGKKENKTKKAHEQMALRLQAEYRQRRNQIAADFARQTTGIAQQRRR